MSKKSKKTVDDSTSEVPSFPETNDIKVIGDVSDYAREYLMLLKPSPDTDAIVKVVEDGTKISDKDYIEVGGLSATEDTKPYVYITAESITPSIKALTLYAIGRGIPVVYSLDELQSYL